MSEEAESPGETTAFHKQYVERTVWAYIFSIAVLVVAALVYWLCLSNHLTQDSLSYIYSAVTGEELIHPHHLMYNPLMRIVAVLLDGARLETIVAALQYTNIVITLMTVCIVWLVVRRIGAPVWASVIYSMFFALSAGILAYSSQVEVYIVTVLFLAVAALGLVQERSLLGPALVAGGWFGAMLFHQTAIFFGVALIVHELLSTGRPSFRRLAIIVGLPLIAVGMVYLMACRLQHCSTIVGCWEWITSYAHSGFWGKGTLSNDTFRLGLAGMFGVLVSTRGKYVVCLLAAFVVMNLLANRRHVIANKALVTGCLAWCLVQGSFSIWWFAPNSEFWIFLLLPLTLSLAAVAHSRTQVSQHSLAGIVMSVPIIIIIAFSAFSAFNHFQRNSRPNHSMVRVAQCVGVITSRDTVVTANNEMRQYCRLYLKTDHIIAFNGPIAQKAIQAFGGGSFSQNLLDVLDAELRQAQKRGGRLFVDQRIVQGSLNAIRLMKGFDAEAFPRDIVRQFNVSPLDTPDPRWYEIHSIVEDTAASAAGFELQD